MALGRVSTAAKAADVAKLLPLNKFHVTHPVTRSMGRGPHLTATEPFSNPNQHVTWSWSPAKSNGFFLGPSATFLL